MVDPRVSRVRACGALGGAPLSFSTVALRALSTTL